MTARLPFTARRDPCELAAPGPTLADVLAELRELRAEIVKLSRRRDRGDDDPRMGAFLAAVFGFSRAEPWTVAQILIEAQRARDREVLAVVDEITGDAADRCISLGRWCALHAGATAGGLMLHQIERNREGVWIYSVSRGE